MQVFCRILQVQAGVFQELCGILGVFRRLIVGVVGFCKIIETLGAFVRFFSRVFAGIFVSLEELLYAQVVNMLVPVLQKNWL